jgi:Icc protein
MSDIPGTAGESRPKKAGAVRILQITDLHFLAETNHTLLGVDTERSFAAVLEATNLKNETADFALLTGDLVQDPCVASYQRLQKWLTRLEIPCYCLPGNHDDVGLMGEILPGGNIHCQPQILLDRWQIICLDSTIPRHPGGRLANSQLDLLDTLLDEQPERYALVALHHHPVLSGSAWMDTMVLENANEFFAVLKKHPQARVVVFGHVHQEMDCRKDALRLIATPSTCFQFKPRNASFALDEIPAGYRWIELYSDGTMDTGVRRIEEIPAGLDFSCRGY